ncbi:MULTISPECIES: hypothetical protein [Pseudomonas]|jgi:hypothetical protein|uniref:Uncharacterized protein n=1 Tax=Pseudomonas fluorescens R124 TaxID=743713 RepID=A0A7U9CUW2_PSEFL|nr:MULTISPECIES: hypothetical protein [Pseudomonas]EJZ59002.1 hypothetical protein I1A_003333 [Pseudomonas fluorescens R124]MBK5343307.1 hypothetical protein [Pseudomonas sp. TH49]MCU1773987.1 hypothetical protein [Pseudomonas sp. 13B_3.2_Bac1]
MNKQLDNWNHTPLLHAGANVINTPVATAAASPCAGIIPRYNVGNIHEIKQFWNMPQSA